MVPKVIGNATGAVLGKVFNPERMYRNALRPTGLAEESDKAVRAGLKGKIGLGWGMADSRAANEARQATFDNEVERLINTTPGDLSPQDYTASVQNGLDQLRGKWMMDPIAGRSFLGQIDDAEREFLIAHGKAQPIQRTVTNAQGQTSVVTIDPEDMTLAELRSSTQPMSLPRAQAIKQQAYRTTRANQKTVQTAWSDQYQSGLGVEARNAISAALREDLENYPGLEALKSLNQESGDSQALDKALEKFARRNMPTVGNVMTSLAGGVGGFLVGHDATHVGYGMGIGLVKHALEDPLVRSRLAIALYSTSPVTRAVGSAVGRGAVRLPISAGKILVDANKAKQGPQEPWQPPPGFAGGGLALKERMRRNAIESLHQRR
jgi:hypothetical protein